MTICSAGIHIDLKRLVMLPATLAKFALLYIAHLADMADPRYLFPAAALSLVAAPAAENVASSAPIHYPFPR
ncbi:MAG: hypothetical protein OEZ03_00430 [Alphaproteobacteria bacterium]|nr:hypothetical protein [Alphaproteobacteria bacterium]